MKSLRKLALGAVLLALVSVMPAWAIWEGNAGIGNAGEFPGSGNFAKSDMFPKNTIVEILNLETNIAIRAVVTGPSGVPGLVAILSPEAAFALNVKTGSVSRVRISVPSPVAETPASGTLSGGAGARSADPDANPESASLVADELAGSTATAPESLAAIAAPAADPLVPLGEDNAASVPESAAPPETALPPAVPEVAEVTEVPETVAETVPSEIPEAPEQIAEEPTVSDVPETPQAADSRVMYDEPELTVPNTLVAPESPVAAEPEIAEAPEASFAPEAPVAVAEPEIAEVPEAPVAVEETETMVTLEPAEMLPPPAAALPPAAPLLAPQSLPTPAPPEVSKETPSETIPLITGFEKGKYYVQIASYGEKSNVLSVMKTWGAKYPLAVELASSKGKSLYKVYVGPVTRDEYGAVLERFKAAGFRDSFVKKGS